MAGHESRRDGAEQIVDAATHSTPGENRDAPCGNVVGFQPKALAAKAFLTCNLRAGHHGDHAFVIPGVCHVSWHIKGRPGLVVLER